jgi:hypothetical protein
MITQDADTLARELRNLSEYTIHAVSRSMGAKGSFRYKYIANDECFKNQVVTRDDKIFRAYRSFLIDEIEKPKPIMMRYVGIFMVLLLLAVGGYFFLFAPLFMPDKKDTNIVNKASINKRTEKKVESSIVEKKKYPVYAEGKINNEKIEEVTDVKQVMSKKENEVEEEILLTEVSSGKEYVALKKNGRYKYFYRKVDVHSQDIKTDAVLEQGLYIAGLKMPDNADLSNFRESRGGERLLDSPHALPSSLIKELNK